MTVSEFISGVANFTPLTKTPSKLVPYFALFLELGGADAVTASDIANVFDEARVRRPANISDLLRKSTSFVRARAGSYRLSHEARERLLAAISPAKSSDVISEQSDRRARHGTSEPTDSDRDVFVVYGRDERLRRDLFSFLRALGLNPFEFDQMAHFTGSASPTTWEIVKAGFARAHACVVLFSPDEHVELRDDLRGDEESQDHMQARPNVFIEAGMALALNAERTVLVKVGNVRDASDLTGINYVRLANDAASRNRLCGKLETAGCAINKHGNDWLTEGNFASNAIGR